MMHYLDTNILVYALINQNEQKLHKSQELIEQLLISKKLLISPLSLQELVFTLTKLQMNHDLIAKSFAFFNNFCHLVIDKSVIKEAFILCQKMGNGKNINDAVHVVLASDHCDQLSTFDKGFKSYKDLFDLQINIL